MLRDEDKVEIKKILAGLSDDVHLHFFTQKVLSTCQFCEETETLLTEVSELSEKLKLKVKNFVTDKDAVESYGISQIPATVIAGKEDYGIRFLGIPTGYEFSAFLEAMIRVSAGESALSPEMKKSVETIDQPVHIQVFVTPTCPYCTRAALTAYQLAIENPHIKTTVVEVSEFTQMGQKYQVMGVPKVVINENHSFEGALPENLFVEKVKEAIA